MLKKSLMLLAITCILISCAKEELVQPEPTVEHTLRTGGEENGTSGNIDGIVEDDQGNGEHNVEVQLDTQDGGYIGTDYTDTNGRYEFDNLSAGDYFVRVRPDTGNEEVYSVRVN